MANSPLSEAAPDSLTELCNRDPWTLTREDRDKIVAYEQAQRLEFSKKEAAGPKVKKVKIAGNATLEDLGL